MKTRYTLVALALSLVCAASVQAEPRVTFRDILKALSSPVPAEWAGVWQTVDSSYKCSPFALDQAAP